MQDTNMYTNYQDGPDNVNRILAHEVIHIAQVRRLNDGQTRSL